MHKFSRDKNITFFYEDKKNKFSNFAKTKNLFNPMKYYESL